MADTALRRTPWPLITTLAHTHVDTHVHTHTHTYMHAHHNKYPHKHAHIHPRLENAKFMLCAYQTASSLEIRGVGYLFCRYFFVENLLKPCLLGQCSGE